MIGLRLIGTALAQKAAMKKAMPLGTGTLVGPKED